MLILQGVLPRR